MASRSALSPRAAAASSASAQQNAAISPHRARHAQLGTRVVETEDGPARVVVDDSESPLAWLARRKGRDGAPMIDARQLLAGERLRAEFTRAHLMPNVTSNWSRPMAGGSGNGAAEFSDMVIAARQRVRHALDAVGPEFSGLLLDVCCFLKGLEDVERERRWPARSAKIVLQLALDRLARHYGLTREARGPARSEVRTWLAPDASFSVESV